jgi:hypothetical protein
LFLCQIPAWKKSPFHGRYHLYEDGVWESRINSSDGGSRVVNSLELLKALAPAIVISSTPVGSQAFREITAQEWQTAVDEVIR